MPAETNSFGLQTLAEHSHAGHDYGNEHTQRHDLGRFTQAESRKNPDDDRNQ